MNNPNGTSLINGLGGSVGFGENILESTDDGFTELIDITPVFPNGLNFFGTNYQGLYINNNGNITFNEPLEAYIPFAITDNTGVPIIAPFFADVDTLAGNLTPSSGGNSTGSNLVYWDIDAVSDQVTVTWDDVGQYSNGTVPNAFQLVLADLGGGDFGITFNYESINWTIGELSDGEQARVGYSAADGKNFFEIPQSGDEQQLLGLDTASNINQPGTFAFKVSSGTNTSELIAGSLDNDLISGLGDDDTLNGSLGADTLNGGNGDDLINGGADQDVLSGGNGNDTLRGNAGLDLLRETADTNFILTNTSLTGLGTDQLVFIESVQLIGGFGNNEIDATAVTNKNVTLDGAEGNDKLLGGALADVLIGQEGSDSLKGGAGNDTLYGGEGNDTLNGGPGIDQIVVTTDGDLTLTNTNLTGMDVDTLSQIESASLVGEAFAGNFFDASTVTTLNVSLDGGHGDDTLIGGMGNDTLIGGADQDLLTAGSGNDILMGDAGNDTLVGNLGNDTLIGGFGNDSFNGANGIDTVSETADTDFILTDTQLMGQGTDTLNQIELANLTGEHGDNLLDALAVNNINVTLNGATGNDTVLGGAKDDSLIGAGGNDVLNGRGGNDTLDGGNNSDTLYGGGGNDVLNGQGGDDLLNGNVSNDLLNGAGGADTLVGGLGNDTLIGGLGNDVFAVQSITGSDIIDDFVDGTDLLGLTGSSSFGDLMITNNATGTATLIRDSTSGNQLLTTVLNIDAADLTSVDFTNI